MSDDGDLFDDDETGGGAFADAAAARRALLADEHRQGRARPGDEAEREAGKRGPGRPKGARNRKSKDFERWFHAKGFTDPLQAMAEYLTADPVELQAWYIQHDRALVALGKRTVQAIPSLHEIQKERRACAEALAPYLHGKKPVQLEIIDERLPALIVNLGTDQLEAGRRLAAEKAMSIGAPLEDADFSEINDLGEGEAGTSHGPASHGRGK